MQYVALLRGVNVGAKARVDMAALRQLFEALGCAKVTTYINSGNVLFSDKRTPHALQPIIEAALQTRFGLHISVVLRSRSSLLTLAAQIPTDWTNDVRAKTDILFVSDSLNVRDVLATLGSKPAIESVIVADGALVWHVSRQNASKSSALKLVGSAHYANVTIRNVNTVRKLVELLK